VSKSKSSPTTDLATQIKAAIDDSGLSIYKIAKESGVPQPVLQRFITGQQANIRLDTASKLTAYFEMRLTAPKPRR
jgi:plasmid maintenance system antidote protein VapI